MTDSNGERTTTLAPTRAARTVLVVLAGGLLVGLFVAAEGCTVTTIGPVADASSDTSLDSARCAGQAPDCFTAYGRICDDVVRPGVDYEPKCTAAGWKCPPGQIPRSQCFGGVPPMFPPDSGADAGRVFGPDARLDASADAMRD